MFELVVFIQTSMVILVTSNPLQGFQSCPVIQYQQNYRNSQQPVIVQPRDYNKYPQQYSVVHQLAPHSVSSSNDDYYNQWYLNNNLSTQRASPAKDPNGGIYDQNGLDYLWYGSNPEVISSSIIKKYGIVPLDNVYDNKTISPNERHYKKRGENRNTVYTNNTDKTKHKKKIKKKRKSNRNTKEANYSNNKSVKQDEHDNKNQPSSIDPKEPVKKRRRKNNTQSSPVTDKFENIGEIKTDVDQNSIKQRQKLTKTKNHNENRLESEDIDVETATIRAKKRSKIRTNKYNSLVATEDFKNYQNEIEQSNNCFDINEDCAELENRKTRNNNNGNKNFQQTFSYMPFDYSMNNIASYINNLMSNPQLNAQMLNTNGNFYYNFDHLYQFPQFQQLTMPYEKRQETNKRTSTKKKKKKSSKDNSRKNSNSNKNCSKNCNETIEISPKFVEVETNNEQNNENIVFPEDKRELKTYQDDESFAVAKSQIDSNFTPKAKEPVLDIKIDLHTNNQVVCEDVIPFINDNGLIDEYYPDFTADSFYLSKENHDWDSFHDRHYYFSDDKNKVNWDKTNNEILNMNNENKNDFFMDNHNHGQIVQELIIEKVQNGKISENSGEQIQFTIPPRLEYPDFQTKKINEDKKEIRPEVQYDHRKEDVNTMEFKISNEDINFDTVPSKTKFTNKQHYDSIPEMYCESSNKIQERKEFQGSKLSAHSNVKTPASDVNQNKKRNQNSVETIFVKSKVIKYGPSQEENDHSLPETSIESSENQIEDKNLISHDGDTYIVIAKSMVNDFYH